MRNRVLSMPPQSMAPPLLYRDRKLGERDLEALGRALPPEA
jgi:hypothetical protein